MPANEKRTVMDRMFEQKSRATSFLASHAESKTTNAVKIEIDIRRGTEEFAVDITPGAGSRNNKKGRYTTKEYEPPTYNESTTVTAAELNTRLPGQNKYSAADTSYVAHLAAYLSDRQLDMQEKIIRSIELQARDAVFDGKIVLHNGDEIDFKKKADHDIAPAVAWSGATGKPLDDIAAAFALVRKNGKVGTNTAKLVVADDVVEILLSNPQFIERANFRHIDRVEVSNPSDINAEGAVYHGTFSAASYTVQLWTYPQFYNVPVGYGLANEGTLQAYIPAGKALLLPAGIDLRLWFAGIATVAGQVDPALESVGLTGGRMLSIIEADFLPYAYLDDRKKCFEVGVESKPLFVPVQIDGFATFNTLIA